MIPSPFALGYFISAPTGPPALEGVFDAQRQIPTLAKGGQGWGALVLSDTRRKIPTLAKTAQGWGTLKFCQEGKDEVLSPCYWE
jgi:hypothetical protein